MSARLAASRTRRALSLSRQEAPYHSAVDAEARFSAAYDLCRARFKALAKVDPAAADRARVQADKQLKEAADAALVLIDPTQEDT